MNVNCKSCGKEIVVDDGDTERRTVTCRACNVVSLIRWPVPMPKGMRVDRTNGDLTITQRDWWFGCVVAFVIGIFILVWLATMTIHLFPLVTAIGVWFSYVTLARLLNTERLCISNNRLDVQNGPLPWVGVEARTFDFDVHDIEQLYTTEFVSDDGEGGTTYTYTLNAVLRGGKRVVLLKEDLDEALFLEQEIEKHLGIETRCVPGETSNDRASVSRRC